MDSWDVYRSGTSGWVAFSELSVAATTAVQLRVHDAT
jgi:hypothetical protein